VTAASVQAGALRAAASFIEDEGTAALTVTVSAGGGIGICAGTDLFTLITLAVAAGAPAPSPDKTTGRWRTAGHLGRHRLAITTSSEPAGETS
jgi:hypothetical protein